MKRALVFSFAFLALTRLIEAHPPSIPTLETVSESDIIYLVQASAVKEHHEGALNNIITFSVTEILRGKSCSSLILTAYEGAEFKEKSEYVLVHNASGFKDCVGWALKGDCEWLPFGVSRDGDKATVAGIGPLDKVREYLRQHPAKP